MKYTPVPKILLEQGLCRDPESPDFFSSDPVEVRRAVNYCAPCPVRFECLQWALKAPEIHGVWGGADQHQIRIACAVDLHGNPVKSTRPAKCPFCRSTRNVVEVREVASRASEASCSACGLVWRRAKSHIKKPRAPRTFLDEAA
jgi:WhiB family redox-sensing transcriptional regulator